MGEEGKCTLGPCTFSPWAFYVNCVNSEVRRYIGQSTFKNDSVFSLMDMGGGGWECNVSISAFSIRKIRPKKGETKGGGWRYVLNPVQWLTLHHLYSSNNFCCTYSASGQVIPYLHIKHIKGST